MQHSTDHSLLDPCWTNYIFRRKIYVWDNQIRDPNMQILQGGLLAVTLLGAIAAGVPHRRSS